jgi:hypothetical protein
MLAVPEVLLLDRQAYQLENGHIRVPFIVEGCHVTEILWEES